MGIYEELLLKEGQVRLLRVEPAATGSDMVRCTLEVVPLSSEPLFFAFSYTWGPPYAEYEARGKVESPLEATQYH